MGEVLLVVAPDNRGFLGSFAWDSFQARAFEYPHTDLGLTTRARTCAIAMAPVGRSVQSRDPLPRLQLSLPAYFRILFLPPTPGALRFPRRADCPRAVCRIWDRSRRLLHPLDPAPVLAVPILRSFIPQNVAFRGRRGGSPDQRVVWRFCGHRGHHCGRRAVIPWFA